MVPCFFFPTQSSVVSQITMESDGCWNIVKGSALRLCSTLGNSMGQRINIYKSQFTNHWRSVLSGHFYIFRKQNTFQFTIYYYYRYRAFHFCHCSAVRSSQSNNKIDQELNRFSFFFFRFHPETQIDLDLFFIPSNNYSEFDFIIYSKSVFFSFFSLHFT